MWVARISGETSRVTPLAYSGGGVHRLEEVKRRDRSRRAPRRGRSVGVGPRIDEDDLGDSNSRKSEEFFGDDLHQARLRGRGTRAGLIRSISRSMDFAKGSAVR